MRAKWISRKDRAGAITAVVLVHAGVLAGLLTLGNPPDLPRGLQAPLQSFDVLIPPEPPPPEPVKIETLKAPEEEGAAAPPAGKAEATPVTAPKPKVVLPPQPTVTAAEKPGQGTKPTQGAAPVDGPGTGAGGQGSGTGSGSGGSGTGGGGGGGGGEAQRPALVSRSLTQRDYSRSARRDWPSGRRVLVSFDVQLSGQATGCRVEQSSGNPAIDSETCRLVTTRLRFRPAKDRSGTPVVARYGYVQYPLF